MLHGGSVSYITRECYPIGNVSVVTFGGFNSRSSSIFRHISMELAVEIVQSCAKSSVYVLSMNNRLIAFSMTLMIFM